jgi:hypothetical protein
MLTLPRLLALLAQWGIDASREAVRYRANESGTQIAAYMRRRAIGRRVDGNSMR